MIKNDGDETSNHKSQNEVTMNQTNYSTSHHSRRSSISLNNIGVSLLERQCFHEAVATLKDAILLLRSSTVINVTPDDDILREKSLHIAFLRLARAKPTHQGAKEIHIRSITTTGGITPIEEESCNAVSNQYTVFRVEEYDCNDSSENIAAILLHTLGIAYFCLSEVEKKLVAQQGRYVERAMRLLKISFSILHGFTTEVLEMNTFTSFFHCTVLNNLISILIRQKRVVEAQGYGSILRSFMQTHAASKNAFDLTMKIAAAA
jgi:hypothetical protein